MSALQVAVVGLGELGNTLVEDLLNETRHEIRVWDWRFDDPSSSAASHLCALQAESKLRSQILRSQRSVGAMLFSRR